MRPERWQQISRIFHSAISLDGEARAAYVADECGTDESLRVEVEKLIDSHQQAKDRNFISGVAAENGAALLIDDDDSGPQPSALNKDQQFGSYVILDRLGAGGMGEVYLARDSRLERTVALKVLSQDISSDKRRMQRFRQEAKVASSLNQPNIVTIFEFGEVDGLTFLATEYIDGETLRAYMRGKRLKLSEILDITIQVLAALDAAHEAHIIHRDIKPENVMIRRRDRVVKVLDFGLAKVTEKRSATLTAQDSASEAATEFKTAPGSVMGTINYMSPEQAQAQAADERTDIWSTGVMLYEMVTGALPFKGVTTSHTIVQILEKEPAPVRYQGQPPPQELRRIVSKAMAKDREERYQTAKDMLIDLRRLKNDLEANAASEAFSAFDKQEEFVPADSSGRHRARQASYKKRNLAIAIAMAVIVVGVFGLKLRQSYLNQAINPATANAPAPPVARTLTYWITVQRFRDRRPYEKPFTLPGEMIFEADYQIRINVRSPQAGYLYILNEGPRDPLVEPEFVLVFPSPAANDGSSFVAAGQMIQIPEQSWLKFDKEQGTERLWLIFAQNAIPELEGAKEFASAQTKGLISDSAQNKIIQNFLNAHATANPQAEKDDKLTTLTTRGTLLVYAIKLAHV